MYERRAKDGEIMKYEYIIFDADHTLIDFDEDERRAFRTAFTAAGIAFTADMVETCWAYAAQNWDMLGLNDVHLPAIQSAYHALYREHVRTLFDFVDGMYGLNGRREGAQAAFEDALRLPAHYVPHAEETVRALAKRYRICVATNGLAEMQRGRLRNLAPLLYRTYISEETGAIKPTKAFFDAMCSDLNAPRAKCLMVGDSLSSDVAGARAAGMDSVWLNRRGGALPADMNGTAEISDLSELIPLLEGR